MKNIRIFISSVQKDYADEHVALRDSLRGNTLFPDKEEDLKPHQE